MTTETDNPRGGMFVILYCAFAFSGCIVGTIITAIVLSIAQ